MKTGWCKALPLFLLVVGLPDFCFAQKFPVKFEHQGTDSVGGRIAYNMREIIRKSESLWLTNENEGCLWVLLLTMEEDKKNPSSASFYSLTICFFVPGSTKQFLTAYIGNSGSQRVYEAAEGLVATIETEWQKLITSSQPATPGKGSSK